MIPDAIRIMGDSADSSRAVLDSSISDCEFVVTALRHGKFALARFGFQSLENVKLFSLFQNQMFTFHCEENLAAMSLSFFLTDAN
jgi:hypothetical protein